MQHAMISSKLTWQALKRNDLTGQADTHGLRLNRLRRDEISVTEISPRWNGIKRFNWAGWAGISRGKHFIGQLIDGHE